VIQSRMAEPRSKPPEDDTAAFQDAVEKGLGSLDRGHRISYDAVRRWLLSWGAEKETEPPKGR
jgi:predicted transcriptional regulator